MILRHLTPQTLLSPTILRDAQRATLQLLSSLSRQFESDEIHITFDEDVKLEWEGEHTINRDGPPAPVADQLNGHPGPVVDQLNEPQGPVVGEHPGGGAYTSAHGGAQRSRGGTGVGVGGYDEPNGRHVGRDNTAGVVRQGLGGGLRRLSSRSGRDPEGFDYRGPGGGLPRLASLSEPEGTPVLSSPISGAAREEGLLLTRFLSNVVVACGQVQPTSRPLCFICVLRLNYTLAIPKTLSPSVTWGGGVSNSASLVFRHVSSVLDSD